MTDTKELILYLNPTQELVKAETVTASGSRCVKYIAGDALTQCIERNARPKERRTGLLPPGCLALITTPDGWDVTLLCDFDRCDLTYQKTLYEDFPIPRIALRFLLDRNGQAAGFRLAVLERGALSPETKTFVCPFPNVRDFDLCAGGNVFTGYDTLWKTRGLTRRVLALPFGDDHYTSKNTSLRCSARDLFERLRDKEPDHYYSGVLLPNGKTLADFLK